jgi:uncharacterized repeat protein (TIGR01451 family)
MQSIKRAVLAAVALLGLAACQEMYAEVAEQAAVPQPSQEQVPGEEVAETGEAIEAGDAFEAEAASEEERGVEAQGKKERWTSSVYYFEDFEGAVGSEWSRRSTDVAPRGQRFLGQFITEDTTLKLKHLPKHDAVTISFDLYVIGTWDGNHDPDIWQVKLVDGPVLLRTTFSNDDAPYDPNYPQAYPDWYPGRAYPGLTGAAEKGTLGYPDNSGYRGVGDSVYHMTFTLPHDSSRLALNFKGITVGGDEPWGLDNVKVTLWHRDGDERHARADLSVKITADRNEARAGETVLYSVRVQNKGPGVATNVRLSNNVSDQFNITGVTCGPGSREGNGCNLGTLSPGASITVRVKAQVCCFPPGESRRAFFNTEVRSDTPDPRPHNNAASITTPIVGDYQTTDQRRVDVFLLKDISTCVIGNRCTTGACLALSDSSGTPRVRFEDDFAFRAVRPDDPALGTAEVSQCLHLRLTNAEVAAKRAELERFRDNVALWTGGALTLDLRIHELDTVEMSLTRWGGGLWIGPWDLRPVAVPYLRRETDFTLVTQGIRDPALDLHHELGGCGGTFGADLGVGGAGHSWIPETGSVFWFQCAEHSVYTHEWLHQLHYAVHVLSGFDDLYDGAYPACGTAAPDTRRWFPDTHDCLRDPDYFACGGTDCGGNTAVNEHILRAHWPPRGMPRLIANHCTNGIQDYDETGVDSGPDCPGTWVSAREQRQPEPPSAPASSLPVPVR